MHLNDLNLAEKNRLAVEYRAHGLVVLPRVTLSSNFQPPRADFVFLAIDGRCEVYIGADTAYVGPDRPWQARLAQPEGPGHTRLIGVARGDFFSGWQLAVAMLQQAGGQVVISRPRRRHVSGPADRDHPLLRDLVEACRSRPRTVIGRDREMTALKTSLLRHSKPGVVLLGPPGVGKTALVEGLATEIAEDRNVPPALRNTPIYDFPLGRLRESGRFLGDIEHEARRALDAPGRPILFLDEIHQLAHPELRPLCDLLKPSLAAGSIRIVGATTPVEWRQIEDPAFQRRSLEIAVAEPSPREALAMARARSRELAAHHGIEITDAAVREAVLLAARYLPMRSFPDKAIDLLDQAAAMQTAEGPQPGPADEAPKGNALHRESLDRAVASQAGMPRGLLDPAVVTTMIDRASDRMHGSLFGQDVALARVGEVLRSQAAERFLGWRHAVETGCPNWSRRPWASFLAVGPTGAGKTATAQRLAEGLFDGRLITLSCSEVGPEAPHAVSMWTGSPPGYVGHGQGGLLTNGLRRHRTAVVLFDEIEKAAPDVVQNILLPLLGEGTVTDRNNGETLWATDCVVVCTSNLVPRPGRTRDLGFIPARSDPEDDQESLMECLGRHLRREVLARFNAILCYRSLDRQARWELWSSLCQDLAVKIGPGTRIVLDAAAQRIVQERLAERTGGARAILDLFREEMVPLVTKAPKGDLIRITVDATGRLRLG